MFGGITRHASKRNVLIVGGIIVLSLFAAVPLLAGPLPHTHDGLHHLFRLFELDRCLRSGVLYPRVFPDMGFGYGYPVLHFYSPLVYYLSWIATAVGTGYIGGIKMAYVVSIVGSALAMYAWTKLFLPQSGAFLASAAYTFAPYHIADIHVRGALAEAAAFVWPPVLLCLITRYYQHREAKYLIGLSVSVAAFVLTHNLTAFMFAPVLLLYTTLLFGKPRRTTSQPAYVSLAVSVLLGMSLAAFYWLPAMAEVRYVLAGQTSGVTGLSGNLQPIGEWLSRRLIHSYIPYQGVKGKHPLGVVQVVVALAGSLSFLLARCRGGRTLRAAIATTGLSIPICVLLLTPGSLVLWENAPFLHYLQFPWRLQAVLALDTAVLAGAIAFISRSATVRWASALLLSVLMAPAGMLGLRPIPAHLPSSTDVLTESQVSLDGLIDYDYQTALWLREYGGEWLLEYLPVWALGEREQFFLPTEQPQHVPSLPTGTTAKVVEDAPLRTKLLLSLPEPARIVFHRFYFPGWTAYVDGKRLPAQPLGNLGLAAVEVPAGEHMVVLRMSSTAPQLAGNVLSALALGAMVVVAMRLRLLRFLALTTTFVALFAALAGLRARFCPTMLRPTPVDAILDESVALVGHSTTQHGDHLDVYLYWLCLAPIDENFKVFVHAVDSSGRTVSQHDGMPGNEFSPTTRWLPGELIVDRHTLPFGDGPLTLYAGMYRWPNIENLPTIQGSQLLPDGRIPLGPVHH